MARFNVVGLDDLQEQMLQRAKIAEEAASEDADVVETEVETEAETEAGSNQV